jgi:hypothetical protein
MVCVEPSGLERECVRRARRYSAPLFGTTASYAAVRNCLTSKSLAGTTVSTRWHA